MPYVDGVNVSWLGETWPASPFTLLTKPADIRHAVRN